MSKQGQKYRFISQNPQVLEVLRLVENAARTDATVLITGETGTGKELIARMVHRKSVRRDMPFIAVNCGSVADTLLESELFGHSKGAFTGANTRKIGKFEAADGGMLFLDELSEMSKSMQVQLLRVLQSGEYSPIGVAENRHCDVRVVGATNEELLHLVAENRFRKDLYYRLNIVRVALFPLRERKSDIPLLAEHFLDIYRNHYRKPDLEFGKDAMNLLMRHEYPGNVRELENVVRRAAILCPGDVITPACLSLETQSPTAARTTAIEAPPAAVPSPVPSSKNFHEAKADVIENFERAYLQKSLEQSGGIVSRAAELSGLSERNFYAKLRKYGINNMDVRRGASSANFGRAEAPTLQP